MVTLEVIAGSTAFTLFSYYFEPSKNSDSDLHKISQVFSSKNLNRLVWSMDSNSKSELWFSPYSDARGNKLSEFISANNLFIINEDCGPTFRATQGTSYIDITVVGSDLLEDNSSWCLSENESLSDHVMIEFEFCLSTVLRDTSSAPFVIFNTKKANWCRFRKLCLSRMTHIFDTLNSCTNSSCLNTVIEELSFVIHQACLYSMPIKKTSKHNVPWWSIEIGCARKRLNASRRRFQRCKNPTVRELYKNSYLEYRKDCNQMFINAKSESWKKFLLTIDAQNVWKKVYTYGVKKEFIKKIEITGIKLPTGETTTSLDETINAVLQKSFPSDSEEKDNIFQKDYRHAARIFPRIWKLAQVILIPKVNEFRVPHLDNLRCISLLPALGKCLEKLFVNRISWYLRRGDFLSSDQYGFTPHKSTEDALLRLNEIVKRGKKKHLHSILISLDIKGAFDNAWWPYILNLLKKAEIPINIFSLVADFLNDRVAKMQLDFADDILVCSQGRDLSATFLHAQEALNFASDWSKSFKLDFNPDKTRFMAIEKRNVCYDAFQLYLDGTPLTMFFFDKGENASQVTEIANYVYGTDTVTANYLQFWFRQFRSGIFDVKGASRTVRPVVENVDKITEIIEVDRPVSNRIPGVKHRP
ncbi:retrovirus-related Pol polyprotein from type-1 retrotransposable element R1 [Trichonephila clavipes]|nr:retrovirus-related Pol polyprotein from type-1 retrotransposable element R1 [Trichonephila clavipes]